MEPPLGKTTQQSQKKEEKTKEANANTGGSMKMKPVKVAPFGEVPPFPRTPSRFIQSNTFNNEATITPLLPRLVLGFPAVCGGDWVGVPTKPFTKQRRHPQASLRGIEQADMDFSRSP
jgi:hypothetical protein